VTFWQKDISAKGSSKMVMTLTSGLHREQQQQQPNSIVVEKQFFWRLLCCCQPQTRVYKSNYPPLSLSLFFISQSLFLDLFLSI